MRGISLFIILIFVSGCASPRAVQTKREGLLDELVRRDEGIADTKNERTSDSRVLRTVKSKAKGWIWPLKKVQVTSKFGPRGRRFHEGIDLHARSGTPVHAVQKGKVVYSGRKIRGYGKMVVLKHDSGLFSIYAHHSRNLVRVGQKVKQGQKIALSGATGRVSGPHLHFEVRRGVVALDPAQVLKGAKSVKVSKRSIGPLEKKKKKKN